jgi:hypothetical protein
MKRQKTNRLFAAAGVAALGLAATAMFSNTASAATVTISSLVPQSGYAGSDAASVPLTDVSAPYDFTLQGYAALTSLDNVTVMLTLNNGQTGVGQLDENNLTLGLDGIDTGIKLNGFLGNQIVTLTLSGAPNNAAAILAALQADGKLVGSIIDANPGNNGFVGVTGVVDTSLDLTGSVRDNGGGGPNPVPLPAAVLLAPLGAAFAGRVARRMRAGAAK